MLLEWGLRLEYNGRRGMDHAIEIIPVEQRLNCGLSQEQIAFLDLFRVVLPLQINASGVEVVLGGLRDEHIALRLERREL